MHATTQQFPTGNSPVLSVEQRADAVLAQLEEVTAAAFALVRELRASQSDGDEWTRMPAPGTRCPVSNFSRSKLERLAAADLIRKKKAGGGSFFSAADVRSFIATANRTKP